MNYHGNKQKMKSNVFPSQQYYLNDAPNQFCDYMKCISTGTRFDEICELYLKGLSMEDVKYLTPDDLICLVPQDHYKHKLLMTIMVRRYLYRNEDNTIGIAPLKTDTIVDTTNDSVVNNTMDRSKDRFTDRTIDTLSDRSSDTSSDYKPYNKSSKYSECLCCSSHN